MLISAAVLSMIAGVQTAMAQKVTLYMAGNQTFECDITRLDSIVFSEGQTIPAEEIVVTVDANGNADGGHLFTKIDENKFYIDDIKYTAESGALIVTGYDKAYFKGAANIISKLIYNGRTLDVVGIASNAFEKCGVLTSVTIPNSVTSIGGYAFNGCSGLTSIIVDSGNTVYDSRNNCNAIIETATNTLIAGCKNTTIPNSVTSIGSYAFYYCIGLTSVTIPNSVTSIGSSAFRGCSSLTSITIPNSVTSISGYAFQYCSGLTAVTIPNCVTSIGNSAFSGCSSLTSIIIPESVTSIGSYAFSDCPNLTSVTLNSDAIVSASHNSSYEGLGSIFGNQVKTYIIGNGVKSIGSYAFSDCTGLNSITIPNSVTSIGSSAFYKCSSLTSITIPNSVTSIGYEAFLGCSSMTSITIPESVTSIGKNAFRNCSSLTSITIPNSMTSINSYTFYDCSGLTSVTIPNSVTSIGDYAFSGCSSLRDVWCHAEDVPDSGGAFPTSVAESATLHVPTASLKAYRTTAPWSQFGSIVAIGVEFVTNLLSNKWSGAEYSVQAATFDSGVNYGDWNDSNPNYNQIVGVPEADANGRNWYEVEYTCNWQEMTAPLNNWCENFGDIYARRTFYYDEEMPEELYLACGHDDAPCEYYLNGELIWSVTDGWFEQEIYKLTSAQKALLRPGELNVLAFHVHQNYGGMYADCGLYTSLSEMGISNKCGDNLTWSFNGETGTLTISGTGDKYDYSDNSQTPWIGFKNSIKNIDVQSGATRIGGNAFNGCTALSSVTISNSVTVMGSWAFCDCKSLTSITIPEGVINIRDNVFGNCSSLTSVTIPNSVTSIDSYAFYDCSSLTSITIPNSVTSIGSYAFKDCSSLTSLTIGSGMTSIDWLAFYYCSSLTDVYCYAENVPSTYYDAFENSSISSATLHVPARSVNSYKSQSPWSSFGSIVAIE